MKNNPSENSLIKIGSQALVVESINIGNSFTVSLDHTLSENLTFDWWVVQNE